MGSLKEKARLLRERLVLFKQRLQIPPSPPKRGTSPHDLEAVTQKRVRSKKGLRAPGQSKRGEKTLEVSPLQLEVSSMKSTTMSSTGNTATPLRDQFRKRFHGQQSRDSLSTTSTKRTSKVTKMKTARKNTHDKSNGSKTLRRKITMIQDLIGISDDDYEADDEYDLPVSEDEKDDDCRLSTSRRIELQAIRRPRKKSTEEDTSIPEKKKTTKGTSQASREKTTRKISQPPKKQATSVEVASSETSDLDVILHKLVGQYTAADGTVVKVARSELPAEIVQDVQGLLAEVQEKVPDWRSDSFTKGKCLSQDVLRWRTTGWAWSRTEAMVAACRTCTNTGLLCLRWDPNATDKLVLAAPPQEARDEAAEPSDAQFWKRVAEHRTPNYMWRQIG
ncbi:unnamed protein product [Zymoseptoria tritici ST99CH_3D1]|nr:unnamed protein product [Zymoseptoria tritici ST99CH_3D1]